MMMDRCYLVVRFIGSFIFYLCFCFLLLSSFYFEGKGATCANLFGASCEDSEVPHTRHLMFTFSNRSSL